MRASLNRKHNIICDSERLLTMVWRQSSHIFNQPQHRRYWTQHSCSITLMQKQQFNCIPRRPPLVTLMEQRVVQMEGRFWPYRWGLRTHTHYTSFTHLMWQSEDSLKQQRNKAIASNNQVCTKEVALETQHLHSVTLMQKQWFPCVPERHF